MQLRYSFFVILALGVFFSTDRAQAATLQTGDLIKIANLPDVYYYGADGLRYVFPNEKTYFSWYDGFNTKTVSETELANVRVGGAVTYKPGYRMVKVTTDPKVYAVSKGGVLRWIETEALAIQLYGSAWATKVHDLPDAYFATYKIGTSINQLENFSITNELAAATSISTDKNLIVVPPTAANPPVSSSSLDINVSNASPRAGDVIRVSATASDPNGITKIEIFFDGGLRKTCLGTTCSDEIQIPISGTRETYEAKAIATALNLTTQTKTASLTISSAPTSPLILTIGRSTIRTGQLGEAIVDIDTTIATIRTDIYVNGDAVEACASGIRQCRWTAVLTGTVGTSFDVYGKVTDSLGRTYTSAHKTISIGINDSPIVSAVLGKLLIYKGETVDMTVTASDDDGILLIEILKDGVVQKTCTSTICPFVTEPFSSTGSFTYTGRATDVLNSTVTTEPMILNVVTLE